jgi:hypothetical protein
LSQRAADGAIRPLETGAFMMIRMTAAAFGLLAFIAAPGAAFSQSSEDQAACREDAVKHCRSHVGKPDDMKKCLVANKDQLTAACKKVVEQRGG